MEMNPPELNAVLRESFGFEAFLPGQRELIQAMMTGRDALGVLPTGGGKSLTYQLPATVLSGLTVVVSPLIALMKDQVDAFNRRGRGLAVAIHSNMPASQARESLIQASRGEACLIYVAPERFEYAGFRDRILSLKPRLFVVDEAHCVNQWGYDFRPSYLALAGVAEALRPAPVLALTATAAPSARKEIASKLGLLNPLVFVAPFDRPNLRFEVHQCDSKEKMRRLRRIFKASQQGESHIVYVGRRKDADTIASELNVDGFGAVAYHAGMQAEARRRAQEAWLSGAKPIAVATVAFGMGIDKPNVRTVVHYQHPSSLEAYYQEAGRAGRDGVPARCVMLYSSKDVSLSHFFIKNRYPTPEQVVQLHTLISPDGTTLDGIRNVADLSDEQLNVALWVLTDQQKIWRDEDGLLRRKAPARDRQISFSSLYARRKADYRRLDEVIGYCEDPVCHRSHLLRYFGEVLANRHRCGNCSACAGHKSEESQAAAEDEVERIYRLNRKLFEERGRPLSPREFARFLASSSRQHAPEWQHCAGYGAFKGTPIARLESMALRIFQRERNTVAGQLRITRVSHAAAESSTAADTNPVPANPAQPEIILWQTANRCFTLEELKKREVARKSGIAVLRIFDQTQGGLAPSSVVNALRGIPKNNSPKFMSLEQFGIESGRDYDGVLADVLAMWAKGYLQLCSAKNRRLELTEKGREVLKKI
jgi:ATP-dependent DNA helicase RecQ